MRSHMKNEENEWMGWLESARAHADRRYVHSAVPLFSQWPGATSNHPNLPSQRWQPKSERRHLPQPRPGHKGAFSLGFALCAAVVFATAGAAFGGGGASPAADLGAAGAATTTSGRGR